MEDPRIISALFIFLKMAYYNVLINIVVLPAKAGEKRFKYEQKVKLVNPKITAEGRNVRGRGYTNYILNADDMLPVEESK